MELLEFKHENDPARNRELFGLLGEYADKFCYLGKVGRDHQFRAGTPLVHRNGWGNKACCGVRISALRTDTDPHPPFIRA